jgi:hypothetical protein
MVKKKLKTEEYYILLGENTRWSNRSSAIMAFDKMTIHASNLEKDLIKAEENNRKLKELLSMYKNEMTNLF